MGALLTYAQTAEYLGSVSESTLRTAVKEGTWPGPAPRRIGHRWLFARAELDEWLRNPQAGEAA